MKLSITNDKLRRTDILTPISSHENTNTKARGDSLYLPLISMIYNRTTLDSTDDIDKNPESIIDDGFRSNLASGEPEQYKACFSTSSATFIVSSLPPSEIIVQQDDYNLPNMIDSNPRMDRMTSSKNSQHSIWFKENWISMTVIAGIIVIFLTIVITRIIY